jgi:hypothetical protein
MSGLGIDSLVDEVRKQAIGIICEVTISLPSRASKAVDFIEKRTKVLHRDWKDDRSLFTVRIGRNQVEQILSIERDLLIENIPAVEALESFWKQPLQEGANCQLPPHRHHGYTM